MLPQQRDKMMLNSAKQNLVAMAFVGLTENQKVILTNIMVFK